VWELKTQTLKNSGLLSLYRGSEDFSRLGGLAALKAFCKRALSQPSRGNPLKRPRGVMLLSPPGCGKSQFCKALGREVGRPVLVLDVGSLMGSLVGQSEERTRQALRIIDAMAPCVAMLDEVEKAFSGMDASGDSGVASRMWKFSARKVLGAWRYREELDSLGKMDVCSASVPRGYQYPPITFSTPLEGLNLSTFLAGMSMDAPVAGLRPRRASR